jgi:predicted transcriptional regulator
MNEPVAWIFGAHLDSAKKMPHLCRVTPTQENENYIPLYTQDQLEEARKLGMQQEKAMWELAASTQEIMDTHPVKEHFEDEPQAEELHEIMQSNAELTDEEIEEVFQETIRQPNFMMLGDTQRFARAILKRAQEK